MTPHEEKKQVRTLLEEAAATLEKGQKILLDPDLLRRAGMLLCNPAPEPFTEWLTCPNCNHKSPYSPIKAKTLEEEAVRLTAQAMQALSQMQRVPKYKASQIHPATDVIMVADLKRFGIKV